MERKHFMLKPVITLDAYLSVIDQKEEILVYCIDDYKVFSNDFNGSYKTRVGKFTPKYLLKNLYSKYLNSDKFSVSLQRKTNTLLLTIDIRED